MAAQYAYVMKDMTKTFPGAHKPVLSNINLQFYQGAKIGIVGPNGAGKSTLIKIMAGIDKDFTGEAWPGENITVGYLEQEPELDPTKTVLENVKDGARETARHGRAVQRDRRRDGRARRRFRRAGRRDGRAAGQDRRGRRLDARQPARDRDGSAALPAGRHGRGKPLGRREAPRRAHPPADPEARHPAARRTDQPPRRRKRPVARKPPQGICRRGADDHPRPLLPRQRGGLDPRARSRQLLPLRRQLLDLPGEEGQAAGAGKPRGERQDRRRSSANSSGSARPPPRARPSPRRASASSRNCRTRRTTARSARRRSSSRCPSGSAAR